MKHFGSILDFTHERNNALIKAWRDEVAQSSYIDTETIVSKIVNSPAPRFWVSEGRAAIVVLAMMRGEPVLDTMRPTKREMFSEIFSRVMQIKNDCPSLSVRRIVAEVVYSPAPKFYMEPSSAGRILCKIRSGFYRQK